MNNRTILTPYFLDKFSSGLKLIAQPGWTINEPTLPHGELQRRLSSYHEPLADFVSKAIADQTRPVSLAGDCCTAIGFLAGLQRAGINPLLIWFDAHGDFNTWETTPSGFLGGMPLAMIVGRGEQTMPVAVGLKPQPEPQVILTDARDLDPGERISVQASAVTHLAQVEQLLEYQFPDLPIYVHFDTDIVRAEESPAQNYLAQGGPSAETIQAVFERLARTQRVIGASLSSWNPELDQDRKSETVSLSLLKTLVGDF